MFRNPNIFSKCILGSGLALATLVPPGSALAKSFKVLYSFTPGDGVNPSGLVADGAGNLYGTTVNGGADGFGVVFKLDANGTETVLYSFTGAGDGANPFASLIMDKKGKLYGTTGYGGADGDGVVFKLAPNGTETVLHSFTGGNDGAIPFGVPIMDKNGNLYGTTDEGGSDGAGVVFKLDANGTETVLIPLPEETIGGDPYCRPDHGRERQSLWHDRRGRRR